MACFPCMVTYTAPCPPHVERTKNDEQYPSPRARTNVPCTRKWSHLQPALIITTHLPPPHRLKWTYCLPHPHPLKKKKKKEKKAEECRLERHGRGNGKVALCWGKSVQKRENYWLILLLRAMGRRQEDSRGVSTWIIKYKAVGSWDGMGEWEVGGVQ